MNSDSSFPTTSRTYRNSLPWFLAVTFGHPRTRVSRGWSKSTALHKSGTRSRPHPTARYVYCRSRLRAASLNRQRRCPFKGHEGRVCENHLHIAHIDILCQSLSRVVGLMAISWLQHDEYRTNLCFPTTPHTYRNSLPGLIPVLFGHPRTRVSRGRSTPTALHKSGTRSRPRPTEWYVCCRASFRAAYLADDMYGIDASL